MNDIYRYNTFDREEVIKEVNDISLELDEEMTKDPSERDPDKEFKLIYKQFIKGLRLSTGNNF